MTSGKTSFSETLRVNEKGKIIGIISLKGGSENQRFSGLLFGLVEVYLK